MEEQWAGKFGKGAIAYGQEASNFLVRRGDSG